MNLSFSTRFALAIKTGTNLFIHNLSQFGDSILLYGCHQKPLKLINCMINLEEESIKKNRKTHLYYYEFYLNDEQFSDKKLFCRT